MQNIPILRDIDFERFYIRMNEMDFKGQKKAELVYRIILIITLILAIIVSYSTQNLSTGVYIIIGGTIFSIIVCVPSWGIFNRNQLNWQPFIRDKKE